MKKFVFNNRERQENVSIIVFKKQSEGEEKLSRSANKTVPPLQKNWHKTPFYATALLRRT